MTDPLCAARPSIIPLANVVTTDDLDRARPTGPVLAADFYVSGAETWSPVPGGLAAGRYLNIDHHAPLEGMQSRVTSTRLALAHLAAGGEVAPSGSVIIHHTDCDSMLSSAILLGLLPPDSAFGDASVAADHTGAPDPIADLLQALDESRRGMRTLGDYLESLWNLCALTRGAPIEPAAHARLTARLARRTAARAFVEAGRFAVADGVALGIGDQEIDGAFFPSLLPEAQVIAFATPHATDLARWVIKLRLGQAAPAGMTLHALGVRTLDPAFGGRWNAGGNKRDGGTTMAPEKYAAGLRALVTQFLARSA